MASSEFHGGRIMRLSGKTALITGAGSGLGEAAARLFASEGAHIAVADISEINGQAITDSLLARGCESLFVKTDVADEDQVKHAIHTTVKHFGNLDILVNSAGLGADHASWQKVIRVNAQGTYYGCKYGAEAMAEGRGGAIVNISTAWAVNDWDDEASLALKAAMADDEMDWSANLAEHVSDSGTAYVLSKRLVNHITRVFAMAAVGQDIRVNAVAPGFTRTEMARPLWEDEVIYKEHAALMPMNRFAQPEEIARAMLFLASPDASYVTGAILAVDAGFSASQKLG
jgi:NAD(P)-dependent dehydrogenase (short-subunit alcohol dehydrogenase family)